MKTLIFVLTLGIVVGVIANPISKQTTHNENKNSVQAESSDSQTNYEEVNTTNGDQEQRQDKPIVNPEPPNIKKEANAGESVDIVTEDSFDNPIDNPLEEKCEHDQTKLISAETPQTNHDSNQDGSVGTVEIIIKENLIRSTDENTPGFFEIPPNQQFPPSIGPLPQFIQGPHVTDEFVVGPQFSGFIEGPQLPGLFGEIPQLPALTEDGPSMSFNVNNIPEDEENNIIDEDYFREDMEKIDHEIMQTAAGFVPTPLVFRRKHKPRRRFSTRRHFKRNPYRRHQIFNPYYYAYYRPSSLRFY